MGQREVKCRLGFLPKCSRKGPADAAVTARFGQSMGRAQAYHARNNQRIGFATLSETLAKSS